MLPYHVNKLESLTDRRVISVDEAKQHCDVTHDDDDTYLAGLIDAAQRHIEKQTQLSAVESRFTVFYRCWPDELVLPRWPAIKLEKVEYVDPDNEVKTVEDAKLVQLDDVPSFVVRTGGVGNLQVGGDFVNAKLSPEPWPTLGRDPYPVRATFQAGFTETTTPADLKHAVKLLVRHWYDERSPVVVGTISTDVARSLASLIRGLKPGFVPGVIGR